MKIRNRFVIGFGVWCIATLFRLLARTLRFRGEMEVEGVGPTDPPKCTYIYSVWHDAIMCPIAKKSLSPNKVAALVSRHRDGSYLDDFMRYLGIGSIRGSSQHGGGQALRELIRVMEDHHVVVTPDGPRGPRRQLKEGIVFLASQTGRPIVPIASRAFGEWTVRGNWTDLTIPKPFAIVRSVMGAPISVPRELSREELLRYRDFVQSEMDRVEAKLQAIISGSATVAIESAASSEASSQRRAA